jgi:two-component system, NarL family, sensor histidine kinase UhpB
MIAALKPHRADQSLLTQVLSEGIAEWDIDADQFSYSDRYCQLLDLEPSALERSHAAWIDRLFSDDRSAVSNAMQQHLQHRTPFELDCRVKTGNGDYRWFRYRGQAEFNKQDQARLMVLSMSDINHAKKLEEEVHNSRVQLRNLTLRVLERQEAERKHIARELHDEIGQVLAAIKLNLQSSERSTVEALTAERLNISIGMVDELANQVRNLSRLLRPPQLDVLGLAPALVGYVESRARSAGLIPYIVCDPLLVRLRPDLETNCFRIAQEALTNVIRHANAKNIAVDLRRYDDGVRLSIKDDGDGFDVAAVRARAARGECLGLFGIEERARMLGGEATFQSAPGAGTNIKVALPLLVAKPRSRTKSRV